MIVAQGLIDVCDEICHLMIKLCDHQIMSETKYKTLVPLLFIDFYVDVM